MRVLYSKYELEEREHLFRTVFESSPDAIFVEDFEGNVLKANPAACRLYGYQEQKEFLSKALYHPLFDRTDHCLIGHHRIPGAMGSYSATPETGP